MLSSKYSNPIENFQASGIKEIGDYTYVLLIDLQGQVLIQRIRSDESGIKFVKKGSQTIEAFWANPASYSYIWVHQL